MSYNTHQEIFNTVFNNAENHKMAEEWLRVHGFDEHTADVHGRKKDKSDTHKALQLAKRYVLNLVCWHIDRYGSNGYGNRPDTIDVFPYWLAHLEYDRAVQARFRPVVW